MDKKEIYQMVLQEMTEHALVQRRERFNEEEQNNYQEPVSYTHLDVYKRQVQDIRH